MKKTYGAFLRNGLITLAVGLAFFAYQKRSHFLPTLLGSQSSAARSITTLYGNFNVTEPVLLELLESSAMERIKKVHQFGVYYFIKNGKPKEYTRYTHSVGVWALLRKYGAPLEEQIAGLLHDASHTVFSHVGDYLFKNEKESHRKDSYQDDIHAWYLQQQKVDQILAKHGYSLEQVLHKNGKCTALDQELPNICADRLEYNLYEGYLEGMLTKSDIDQILADLTFKEGKWFFSNPDLAKKFAEVPLFLTAHHWGSPGNFLLYSWAARALKRAVDLKLVTWEDVHFSVDEVVWQKLIQSKDSIIADCINKMNNHGELFTLTTPKASDCLVKVKFRGIDPLVKQGDELKRLSEIDEDFAKKYQEVKGKMVQGWPIKLVGDAVRDKGDIALVVA